MSHREPTDTLRWCCESCGERFETEPSRHDPTTCSCGDAFVDHEDYMVRHNVAARPVYEDGSESS